MLLFILSGCTAQNGSGDNMVSNPETAIEIARAILNEHFSDSFLVENPFDSFDFVADTNNGIWVVRTDWGNPVTVVDDDMLIVRLGVNYWVHIRKSNGEILRVEVG